MHKTEGCAELRLLTLGSLYRLSLSGAPRSSGMRSGFTHMRTFHSNTVYRKVSQQAQHIATHPRREPQFSPVELPMHNHREKWDYPCKNLELGTAYNPINHAESPQGFLLFSTSYRVESQAKDWPSLIAEDELWNQTYHTCLTKTCNRWLFFATLLVLLNPCRNSSINFHNIHCGTTVHLEKLFFFFFKCYKSSHSL